MSDNNTANSGRQFQYENHILPDGRVLPIRIRHRPVPPTPPQIPPAPNNTPESSREAAKGSDYLVGYCKPPEATKFKTGRSGNPKGRPKGSPNMQTALINMLDQKITIIENGKSKQIPGSVALARKAFGFAIQGRSKPIELFIKADESRQQRLDSARQNSENKASSKNDQEIIDLFLQLMRGKPDQNDGGDDDNLVC